MSESFCTEEGLRQGGALSPLLFILYTPTPLRVKGFGEYIYIYKKSYEQFRLNVEKRLQQVH